MMHINRPITVLGAGGWIGSALVSYLNEQNCPVNAVNRRSLSSWLLADCYSPVVIYAIGLTADFRYRPFQTIEAHVAILSKVLRRPGVEALLMISSTRVYNRSADTAEEALLPCLSSDPSDLYNLSKLLGEALVLQDPRPEFKVVRLSNVFGSSQPKNTFLGSVMAEARKKGSVVIRQAPETEKDYILLDDVVKLLPLIALFGSQRIYNLASGRNTTHAQIADILINHGIYVDFARSSNSAPLTEPLKINRLLSEFHSPGYILDDIGTELILRQLSYD